LEEEVPLAKDDNKSVKVQVPDSSSKPKDTFCGSAKFRYLLFLVSLGYVMVRAEKLELSHMALPSLAGLTVVKKASNTTSSRTGGTSPTEALTTEAPTYAPTVFVREDPAFVNLAIEHATRVSSLDPSLIAIGLLDKHGFGSEMVNMLAQKICENKKGFNYIVDDSAYRKRGQWQWDGFEGGVMSLFVPTTLQNLPDVDLEAVKAKYPKAYIRKIPKMKSRKETRHVVGTAGYRAYRPLAVEACANLKFHEKTWTILNAIKAKAGIPADLFRRSHSVAFHVRRGDKITGLEDIAHKGMKYVDKVLSAQAELGDNRTLENCFVATDDYAAVVEVKEALLQRNVTCNLHTLTQAEEAGSHKNNYSQHLEQEFLAEVSLLVDATYFVGTWKSNVAGMTALMRKCVHPGTPHFSNSYGVDGDRFAYP